MTAEERNREALRKTFLEANAKWESKKKRAAGKQLKESREALKKTQKELERKDLSSKQRTFLMANTEWEKGRIEKAKAELG